LASYDVSHSDLDSEEIQKTVIVTWWAVHVFCSRR